MQEYNDENLNPWFTKDRSETASNRVPEKLIEQYYPIIYDENTVNSDDQCQRQTPKYIENIKLELNDIFYKYINSN